MRPTDREALLKVVDHVTNVLGIPLVQEVRVWQQKCGAALDTNPAKPWSIKYWPGAMPDGELADALLHEAGHALSFRKDKAFFDQAFEVLPRYNRLRRDPMAQLFGLSGYLSLNDRRLMYEAEVRAWQEALLLNDELELDRSQEVMAAATKYLAGYRFSLGLQDLEDLPTVI